MARTKRGRKLDRKLAARGQTHEVRYEAKKTGKLRKRVKSAIKRVGNSRKKVERELANTIQLRCGSKQRSSIERGINSNKLVPHRAASFSGDITSTPGKSPCLTPS